MNLIERLPRGRMSNVADAENQRLDRRDSGQLEALDAEARGQARRYGMCFRGLRRDDFE